MSTAPQTVYCIKVKSNAPMATFNIFDNIEAWDDIMGQMIAFVNDTNADIDMAHDWVCEMLEIGTFVDNQAAWDSFCDVWESRDNRNDTLPCD